MTNSSDSRLQHTGDPALARAEEELRRGNYLTGDDRPLARILEDDAAAVTRLGIDLEAICKQMKRFYDEGCRGFDCPVIMDDMFEVTVREDRGIIPCPWGDQFASPKVIVEAVNLKNQRKLTFSILGWHMICAHGFFQGRKSPFRIEPKDLREFFL